VGARLGAREGRLRAALAVWVLLALGAAGEDPGRRWKDGPVRILLTPAESRRYARLETPEARRLFVQRFWARLDPEPATARNEFRETFEERAAEASRRFAESVVPGWATDRGRAFLLLGEPTEIRTLDPGWSGTGREIWTWSAEQTGAGRLEIPFDRGVDGRMRIPQGTGVADDGHQEEEIQDLWRRALRTGAGSLAQSALAIRLAERNWLGTSGDPLPSLPVVAGRPIDADGPPADATAGAGRLQEGVWFFQARDASIVALFALRPADPDQLSRAWIWPSDSPEGVRGARPIPLAVEEGMHAGRVWLEPGEYEVRWAVEDPARKSRTVRSVLVSAPELGVGGLAASSVVPAERFGPAPSADRPFAIGSEEIVPRPDGAFRRGETLRLYLQVYGAAEDPTSGEPRVDVRFRFERQVRGRWRREGNPLVVRAAHGASMGLALPVGDWPTGEYRVRVDLRDRVSGTSAVTEGAFRIVDG